MLLSLRLNLCLISSSLLDMAYVNCFTVIFALLARCTMGSSSWVEHRNLERSARELNTTDQDEVKVFIQHWASIAHQNSPRHPPLASQAAIFDLEIVRRQEGCSWTGGGTCNAGYRCCGSVDNGWCCPSDSACCADGSRSCCDIGTTCCLPSGAQSFVCPS
ncbi:hypothetical protein BKA56DRAFT_315768 [Ilyonectria sp. MPI-CAGE-AT-0026]|nr:hypothetical protein BKA56DRAFT_315768 [Ilyonectria sp. MPI-CAGE-AT-0026]